MNKFKLKSLNKSNRVQNDTGINVKELIELISNSKYKKQIQELLEIEKIKDEFIEIPGAKTLIEEIKKLNKKFVKIDINSKLSDISFFDDKGFTINFNNLSETNNDYFDKNNYKSITTIPIYSASRDFFSNLFNMDKYAQSLINNGHNDILSTNLEIIKTKKINFKKKFRIIHDTNENKFYLRAITSTNNYYNYDNNITVVVSLLVLHNEMKKNNIKYSISNCEYNESRIRIFYESYGKKKLEKIGYVKNLIEVSNDEIKREALRFTGINSIIFSSKSKKSNELYIKPKNTKSLILSIKHNQSPEKAIKELGNIDRTNEIHKELYNDIENVTKIKDAEQIKFLIRRKIENAKREEIKKHRQKILKVLDKKVKNIIELLDTFNKIELIISTDIEAKEYLRYIAYETLTKKNK